MNSGAVWRLTELAVHDIDLIEFIIGKRIENKSIYTSRKIHNHYEDNAVLSFQLENNIVASITTNWLTPFKKRTFTVTTADAYFEADLITQTLTEFRKYAEEDDKFTTRNCYVQRGEPLKRELETYLSFLETGDRGDLASIADSVRTLEIIEG